MDATTEGPKRFVFSSADLPTHLDDEARFRLWRDVFASRYGSADIVRLPDKPFAARSEIVQFGAVGLVRSETTARRFRRTSRQAADGSGAYLIAFNAGTSPTAVNQHGKEAIYAPDQVWLCSTASAIDTQSETGSKWIGVSIPAAKLAQYVPGVDDLVTDVLDGTQPAIRHLRRYVELLLAVDEPGDDAPLNRHVDTTLLGLVALSLGANGDVAEIAGTRGLRAARIQAIVAGIRSGYADPAFSVRGLALKVGLAPRSVQNLLSETGTSFTERVLELRLQKARAMLASPRLDKMRIGDIAYACGFNEVSYFNRSFRRRFGCSPRELRASNAG
jgi:AraC-like DNA-binding protein